MDSDLGVMPKKGSFLLLPINTNFSIKKWNRDTLTKIDESQPLDRLRTVDSVPLHIEWLSTNIPPIINKGKGKWNNQYNTYNYYTESRESREKEEATVSESVRMSTPGQEEDKKPGGDQAGHINLKVKGQVSIYTRFCRLVFDFVLFWRDYCSLVCPRVLTSPPVVLRCLLRYA